MKKSYRFGPFFAGALFASAAMAFGPSAHAYDMGWYTPGKTPEKAPERAPAAPVSIRSSHPALVVDVYTTDGIPGTSPVLFTCTAPCETALDRGRYRLYVHETSNTTSGSRVITVGGPSVLQIDPRGTWQAPVGLTLGLAGTAAFIGGIVIAVLAADQCVYVCETRVSTTRVVDGLLLMGLGAIAAPVGWVMFGKSFRPAVDVVPIDPRESRVAPSLFRRPATFGVHVDF